MTFSKKCDGILKISFSWPIIFIIIIPNNNTDK